MTNSLRGYFAKMRMKRRAENDGPRRDPSHRAVLWVTFVFFTIYAITLVLPLVWVFINSLRNKLDFFDSPFSVGEVIWSNYAEIFKFFNLGEMFFNTATLVAVIPIAGLFTTVCAAYAVAKFQFRSRGLIYGIAISVMFIPTSGSLVTMYKLMSDSRLIDTYLGMIVMSLGGFGFNFLLLHGVFRGVSETYAEAAHIDGAGYWRTFIQIILPQVMPTLSALWVLAVIGCYNDYTGPYLFYSSHPTVATGLKELEDGMKNIYVLDYPKLFAAIIVTTLPMILLFILSQKQIIKLNLGGGLKG